MASYKRLPEYGYEHGVVVHDQEFVNSEDRSIHTQNIEARNRWTKATVKSYRGTRSLNSYCAEYTYRLNQQSLSYYNFVNTNFCAEELKVLYVDYVTYAYLAQQWQWYHVWNVYVFDSVYTFVLSCCGFCTSTAVKQCRLQ